MPKYEWRPTEDDPEIFQLHREDGKACLVVADRGNAIAFSKAIQKKGVAEKHNRQLRRALKAVCNHLERRVAAEIDPDDQAPHPMIADASKALEGAEALLKTQKREAIRLERKGTR